jgi:hypothetical protein
MLMVWQTSVLAPKWVVASILLGIGIVLSLYLRDLRRIIEVRKVLADKKKQV